MDLCSFATIFNPYRVISDILHIFPFWYFSSCLTSACYAKWNGFMIIINIWVWALILICNIIYILCEILSTFFISHEVPRSLTLTSEFKCSLQFPEMPCPLYSLSNTDTVLDLIICTCAVKSTKCFLSFVEQTGQFYVSHFIKLLWTKIIGTIT